MTTFQLKRYIRRELDSLNHKIDVKIVRGQPYAREAKKHKTLLRELYGLNNSKGRGLFSFLSTLIF